MTSQHGAYALRAGLARLYARMSMPTPTRPRTHMHARAGMQSGASGAMLYKSNMADKMANVYIYILVINLRGRGLFGFRHLKMADCLCLDREAPGCLECLFTFSLIKRGWE